MTILITDEDVKELLSMKECVDAMRVAFSDLSNGRAVNRPRVRYLAEHPDPERRYFANVHVGAVPSSGMACVRAGSQIMRPPGPKNERRMYENPGQFNWGVVILYSLETAEPLAFMHEFQLSGLRVGATTGAAIQKMAPPNASRVGLFGTGKQARNALEAILTVRPIERVNVYSQNKDHLAGFVREKSRPGLELIAVKTPRDVIEGVDIVCCATSATKPLFDGRWLVDGQFVVTIANSDVTNQRSEADRTTFDRASAIIVNDWDSVVENFQNELLDPIKEGSVERENVFELGDVFNDKVTPDYSGITYFKNNSGLAIQFAAAGGAIYRKAMARGGCKTMPTEWFGSDLSAYYAAGYRPSP